MKRSILLLTQDLQFGGGIARVHQAAARVLRSAGHDVTTVQIGTRSGPRVSLVNRTMDLRGVTRRDGTVSLQAFLPELQAPPLLSARLALRPVLHEIQPSQIVVVGATLLHGWSALGAHLPMTGWGATTVGAERGVQWGSFGPPRRFIHKATLPLLAAAERQFVDAAGCTAALSRYGTDVFSSITSRPVATAYLPIFRPFCAHPGNLDDRVATLRKRVVHLAFVGRVADGRKGFPAAVAVADSLASDYGWRVRLSVTASAGAVATLRASPRVEVRPLGRLDDTGLSRELRSAHWLLLTSSQEGFGIVVAEAMTCGTPVASTPSGGPDAEIRASGAGIVDQAQHLPGLIADQCEDPDSWVVLARRAGLFAAEHFSADAAVPRLLSALLV